MALDFQLSDEQRQLQAMMKKCLEPFADRLAEIRRRMHTEKEFPPELWDAIVDTGLIGAVVPEAYGGNGMGMLAMTLGIEALAQEGVGNALLILTAMDAACLVRAGSEDIKQRYLPKMASGELKFCYALTEPDAGTNAFRITTHLKRDGDDYLVTGQKVFITGADLADKALVVGRTTTRDECQAQGLPKMHGLALFVLDMQAKGIELRPIPTRGIEGMTQYMLYMDEVRVPAHDLVGEPDMGAQVMFQTLNPERILAAASALGIADRCLRIACDYANTRKVFRGQPIGAYQGISHPLAKVRIELEAARLLTYKAAWSYDQQHEPRQTGTSANMAKYYAAEMAIDAVDRAIQTLGGYGFSEEYEVIHYHDSVRLLRTAPITAEMILNFIAEHELGLPRGY